jgi:hypothetical protein
VTSIAALAGCVRLAFDPIAAVASGDGALAGDAGADSTSLDLAPLVPGGSFYEAYDVSGDGRTSRRAPRASSATARFTSIA